MKNSFIAGGAGCIGSACKAESIIRSVWDWMVKFPNGYQD